MCTLPFLSGNNVLIKYVVSLNILLCIQYNVVVLVFDQFTPILVDIIVYGIQQMIHSCAVAYSHVNDK